MLNCRERGEDRIRRVHGARNRRVANQGSIEDSARLPQRLLKIDGSDFSAEFAANLRIW